MHTMAEGAKAKWLARAACLLFTASLVAAGPAPKQAEAQEVTATFKIVPVAVLDFVNKTPYQAGILGSTAGDRARTRHPATAGNLGGTRACRGDCEAQEIVSTTWVTQGDSLRGTVLDPSRRSPFCQKPAIMRSWGS